MINTMLAYVGILSGRDILVNWWILYLYSTMTDRTWISHNEVVEKYTHIE